MNSLNVLEARILKSGIGRAMLPPEALGENLFIASYIPLLVAASLQPVSPWSLGPSSSLCLFLFVSVSKLPCFSLTKVHVAVP